MHFQIRVRGSVRRDGNGQLVPYYDRAAIEAGALDGQKLEICWLKDPLDLLAIQIEGSGRVILEDGTPLRINYDSHNGYSLARSVAPSLNTIAFRAKRYRRSGFGSG
jgi:Membrane-bound lytic murein transglycosylase